MDIRFGRPISAGFGAFALTLASGAARADSVELEWIGIAYLWAADISVDSRDASIAVDFDDVVDKLEFAFQGHAEAQADDFGGFVDVSYLSVGDNREADLTRLNADLDMMAMDLALVWSPAAESFTGAELYGGLRYVDVDFGLVVDFPVGAPLETGIDKSYYDLLVGARYIMPLDDRWRLTFAGDVSSGDTEGTWSLGAFAGYRTGPHHFIAGYRHFEMEVEAENGEERVKETFSGPLIAYGYSF
jgi:hypothetical protein